jgi:hypothetical protein
MPRALDARSTPAAAGDSGGSNAGAGEYASPDAQAPVGTRGGQGAARVCSTESVGVPSSAILTMGKGGRVGWRQKKSSL